MTSTADMAQHPDVSEISDLHEGLLPPSRTAAVRRHLDGCALCADVHDSLTEIRELLGTLPGPPRMPADIAGRIDAALAAEALLDATAPTGAPVPVGATAVSTAAKAPSVSEAESDAARVSRETSPATAPGDTPAVDRPAGHPRAATGPGRRPAPRRRRNAVLGAVFGAAAIGVGVLLVQNLQQSDGGAHPDRTAIASPQAQGPDLSGAALSGQVRTLLAAQPGGQSAGNSPSDKKSGFGVTSNSPKLTSEVSVPTCVQAGTGRTAQAPLAAETGDYRGTRAYLVVFPHPTDASQVQAYVVDAACESAGPDAKGKLLLTHVYPRR
ncbi:anti-sigma factor family protein [Streptomyces sp. YS-3]|uniref:anti-sigma factor family protein n=1 Tax=Streptomyces sp. YS-3 TaxID=3381352 RepID=UPI003862994B